VASQYGDLKQITFEVRGIEGSSLLMHSPAGMSKRRDTGIGPKVIPTPEEEAEAGCYRLPSGQLYLPMTHFRGSILGAASGQKINKKSAKTHFAGGLFALELHAPLYHPETGAALKEYEIDIQRAVVMRAGVSRARACLPQWAALIRFQYEPLLLTPEIIETTLQLAGAIVGVGDYRPQKGGPYGRYVCELSKPA
jgi:hypothetical protein